MAEQGRFAQLSNYDFTLLESELLKENTIKTKDQFARLFSKFLDKNNIKLEGQPTDVVCGHARRFLSSARTMTGKMFKEHS